MNPKKDETASFVIRFTQKIFQSEQGESQVQWRGKIRHVQGGDEKRFSEFENVVEFIQEKLADLTILAMEDKSPEEQKGILEKSFDMWKKMAFGGPKMVIDTLKDPKKQVEQFQSQLNEVSDSITEKIESTIGNRLDVDEWRGATKSDYKNIMGLLNKMSDQIEALNEKVEKLSK